jgi:hypothetical protein
VPSKQRKCIHASCLRRQRLTPYYRNFTIEKLQDAYDCDLDLRDTVSSIFGGETDATMRMIKVVPSFRDRHSSVPVTSHLRPEHVRKRTREVNGEGTNKRRRTEQLAEVHEGVDLARDQPVPSTEHSGIGSHDKGTHSGTRAVSHTRRSHTASSLVFIHDFPLRKPEVAISVKEEPPELSPPPSHDTEPNLPDADGINRIDSDRIVPGRRNASMQTREEPQRVNGINEPVEGGAGNALERLTHDKIHSHIDTEAEPELEAEQEDDQDTAVLRSLLSSPVPPQSTTTRRRDVYDVPSSPEFLNFDPKPRTTYGRSPRTTTTVQKELNLLNNSRVTSTRTLGGSQSSFKRPQSQTPQSSQPKPRGRPRKHPVPESTVSPDVAKKPGRPAKRPASKRTSSPEVVKKQSSPIKKPVNGSTLTPGVPKRRGRPPKQTVIEEKDTHEEASSTYSTPPSPAPVPHVSDNFSEPKEQENNKEASPIHSTTSPMVTNSTTNERLAETKEKGDSKEGSPVHSTSLVADTTAPVVEKVPDTKQASPKAVPWNTESWGFGNLNQLNGTVTEGVEESHDNSRVNGVSPIAGGGRDSPESDADEALDTKSKSRSRSAADSVRSSPAITRRPARFLSRSPSHGKSGSDSESEERSASRSNPASPQPAPPNGVASQSDSSSESDESSTEDGDDEQGEQDEEMPDASSDPKPNAATGTATQILPSSPPHRNSTTTPTPPDTRPSRPPLSQITQPTPGSSRPQLSQAPNSSQSVSAQAAARRPVARYTSFRSIREQLEDTKAAAPPVQKKAYDPRTVALSKLTGKKPGGLGDDESSDDDSSSSSSSSDSD